PAAIFALASKFYGLAVVAFHDFHVESFFRFGRRGYFCNAALLVFQPIQHTADLILGRLAILIVVGMASALKNLVLLGPFSFGHLIVIRIAKNEANFAHLASQSDGLGLGRSDQQRNGFGGNRFVRFVPFGRSPLFVNREDADVLQNGL